MVVTSDIDLSHIGLRTFLDFECHVQFGFVIADPRIDFDVFISLVAVKSLQVRDALFQQFLADAAFLTITWASKFEAGIWWFP